MTTHARAAAIEPRLMAAPRRAATVLALHHGYRVAGGEERAAAQLAALAEGRLGEHVEWLRRDSTQLSAIDAARGLIGGGLRGDEVRDAVVASGADLVHAHNLFPTFGPAALGAARAAGAAVVVHLHNYRLVCAVAVAVRDGHDCTDCHVGRSLPGLRHRCRGSLPEAAAYAVGLPRWQRSVIDLADVVVVPSQAAAERLETFGLDLPAGRLHVVGGVAEEIATASAASAGRYALLVTRLAPEKDIDTAIDACHRAGLPLVIAGDGPERARLEQVAAGVIGGTAPALNAGALLGGAAVEALGAPPVVRGGVAFVGRASDDALRALRGGASVGLALSVAHETFGLAALESMAAALPTIGSAVGALPELLGDDCTVPPGDPAALAAKLATLAGSDAAGLAAARRAAAHAAPAIVAERLAAAYAAARAHRDVR